MSRAIRRHHRVRAVARARFVYRLWWRSQPGPDDRCDPLGPGPSAADVEAAACRLADNLACSTQRASARDLRREGRLARHEARAAADALDQLREAGYA